MATSPLDMGCMEPYQRLELLREKRGFSMAEVARRMGEPRSTVSLWFDGSLEPKLSQLPRLAKVLGTTVAEMVGEARPRESLTADQSAIMDLVEALNLPRQVIIGRLIGKSVKRSKESV